MGRAPATACTSPPQTRLMSGASADGQGLHLLLHDRRRQAERAPSCPEAARKVAHPCTVGSISLSACYLGAGWD